MEMTFDKILEDKRLWAEGMMKSSAIEFLEAHQSSTPSRWHEEAQWRRDNEYWLNYSRSITLQVLQALDEQSVTQAMSAGIIMLLLIILNT